MVEPNSKLDGLSRIFYGSIVGSSKRALPAKAVIFGLIGVLNTVVDFGVFWVVAIVGGSPLILANVSAWLIAVSGSYVMNSLITFHAESGRDLTLRAYLGFVTAGAFGFMASSVVLVLAALHTSILLAKLLAMGVSFGVNFSMSHFVVFRERPPAA